ncbi:hypothetical protein [Oceanirhabdus sp. W0125-5]|uniref:hypothetical protein n=1 Tax=Oceanirhabdus sp. W0125-5 TaxID=2999116 RepID=UPI0022F34026|nr:hypothetical protein [Oceanirhabdus sp. W0125-5]WBW98339.1 hypothetical protein OW730_06110 [Oceanirhabdus sp. W0125-5]
MKDIELTEMDFEESIIEKLETIKNNIKDFLLIESPFIDPLSMVEEIFDNESKYPS